jgi:hypothetical protein
LPSPFVLTGVSSGVSLIFIFVLNESLNGYVYRWS